MDNYPRQSGFKVIDHTADIGIHISATSLADLFLFAIRGMQQFLGNITSGQKIRTIHIQLNESTIEDLLVAFLSELNYHLSVKHYWWSEILSLDIIEADGSLELNADVKLAALSQEQMWTIQEIKSITYHQLQITLDADRYETKVFFDI